MFFCAGLAVPWKNTESSRSSGSWLPAMKYGGTHPSRSLDYAFVKAI